MVLLGVLAIRMKDQRLEWDSQNLQIHQQREGERAAPHPVPRGVDAVAPGAHGEPCRPTPIPARPAARPLRRAATLRDSPSASGVRANLAELLSSAQLVNAERLSSLLRFIVEETLEGRGSQLKEARIGLDVFGRKADSYDPAFDPIVRVQMGRLRAKLRAYYQAAGAADPVRIDIPVGSYAPVFESGRGGCAGTAPQATAVADDLRIAVLPIVNMSAEAENQYFCDGLTEELINRLAQIPALRVVARTSSFQFKDAARDIREVGRLLDVSKVLEGSVRQGRQSHSRHRAADQRADGCHLWSERYEGDLTDIFAIHEQISTAVQRALQMKHAGRASRAGGVAAARGRGLQPLPAGALPVEEANRTGAESGARSLRTRRSGSIRVSRAHSSGVADCHLMLGMSAAEMPERCMPNAAGRGGQALQLDDSLAEAHASLAAVKNCYDGILPPPNEGYRRAIELDPSYATAFHWLGFWVYATRGPSGGALECLEQAIELDPLSPPIIADVGDRPRVPGSNSTARRCTAGARSSSTRTSIDRSGFSD